MVTTIDHLGIDLLRNILARLPAVDFASANGVSSLFHHGCRRVLCRPKLSSACSLNPSLHVAVEEVVNKILSEPMRPHFAIASIGFDFHSQEAVQFITARLGSNFPIITHSSNGFMGRDALSQEFKESPWDGINSDTGIMLVVGFLPGMEVKKIPLLTRNKNKKLPGAAMIDKFITDIREFSTSISGCKSPAAIIMYSLISTFNTAVILEKLDYEMSPETVIVGDFGSFLLNAHIDGDITIRTAAVALVFVRDKNKPLGIGETQFHSVSASGMLPLGPAYEVTSFKNTGFSYTTSFAAKKEGSHENLDAETILGAAHDEAKKHSSNPWPTATREGPHGNDPWDMEQYATCPLYIGVTKGRTCSTGQENVGLVTSFAFHEVFSPKKNNIYVLGVGLEAGDRFHFYIQDSATALSSAASVSNHLRSLKQGSTSASGGDKREVFGGLIFTSCLLDGPLSILTNSFFDNFPSVTLGVTFCRAKIGCDDLSMYAKESQQQKSVFNCVNEFGAACLIMSYTP